MGDILEMDELDDDDDSNIDGEGRLSMQQKMPPPPIELIPDPLLVAAQHAATGGGGTARRGTYNNESAHVAFDPNVPFRVAAGTAVASSSKGGIAASAGMRRVGSVGSGGTGEVGILVMGDCCSSVTEEENSLAETRHPYPTVDRVRDRAME